MTTIDKKKIMEENNIKRKKEIDFILKENELKYNNKEIEKYSLRQFLDKQKIIKNKLKEKIKYEIYRTDIEGICGIMQ